MQNPLNLPPSIDDAMLGVFTSALAMVKPPVQLPRPTRTDALNIALRQLALNASASLQWPEGSRGRNYANFWLQLKTIEVMG